MRGSVVDRAGPAHASGAPGSTCARATSRARGSHGAGGEPGAAIARSRSSPPPPSSMPASMSAISSVGRAPPPPSYDAAMLRKVKQQTELEGEATLALLDSAKPPARADGTASIIDDVA